VNSSAQTSDAELAMLIADGLHDLVILMPEAHRGTRERSACGVDHLAAEQPARR
jgi:hypothetical protein